ncbi:hypothetical protein Dimus_007204, partial [Dionaea muscipula]
IKRNLMDEIGVGCQKVVMQKSYGWINDLLVNGLVSENVSTSADLILLTPTGDE